MTSRDFCYWLQGFFEISSENAPALTLSNKQVELIKKHLNLVFVHDIDPKAGNKEVQEKLDTIHGNKPGTARC